MNNLLDKQADEQVALAREVAEDEDFDVVQLLDALASVGVKLIRASDEELNDCLMTLAYMKA